MMCAEKVSMTYPGGNRALDNVSLEVPDRHVYCLLGANGAGKSTLIYLFLDFIRPDTGRTMVDGIVVQNEPVSARKRLAYLPDQLELYEGMTGLDNLSFFCQLSGRPTPRDGMLAHFDTVNLDRKWAVERVGNYSRGMKQKLGLSILLGRGATSFLLDEPTSGLDPQSSSDLVRTIKNLKSSGASILMSTHDLLRAQQVADMIGILRKGRLVAEFSREQIGDLDLERTYLDYFEYNSRPDGGDADHQ